MSDDNNAELRRLRDDNSLLRDVLEQAEAALGIEAALRQRVQQALRKIDERIPSYRHYRGCGCSECAWLGELKSIAKKGLGV